MTHTPEWLALSPSEKPTLPEWCSLLLDNLEEFATLAWFLVADGKLVEEAFARAMAQLETTPLDTSDRLIAHDQARKILIAQAIEVVEAARKDEMRNGMCVPTLLCELPDLPRLAFLLRMVVPLPAKDVAEFLHVTPSRVHELVENAISQISVSAIPS
jgi:DNA-directed RNA polymerase specialized sigma24 family protein